MDSQTTRATTLPLLLGFSLLLILMGVQVIQALSGIRSMREDMQQIVEDKLVKNNLAQAMLSSARERGMILTLIYYEEDPFERDELTIKFSNYAGSYLAAREKLRAMNLSPEEREVLVKLDKQTEQGTPAMSRVMSLLLSDEGMNELERDEAMVLIRDIAIPAREAVSTHLQRISQLTLDSSKQAIAEAEFNYYSTREQLLSLAIAIFVVALIIIFVVYRKVTDTADQIDKMHKEMHQQVSETVLMFKVSMALIQHSMRGGDHSIRDVIDQLSGKEALSNAVREQIIELRSWQEQLLQESRASEEQCDLYETQMGSLETVFEQSDHSLEQTLIIAITAFQGFDRITQQLEHIGKNLNETAELLSDPLRINDPVAWKTVQQEMRDDFVTVDAQVLYDAIMGGEDTDTALKRADEVRRSAQDHFEMF
ncbi:MAG: hypothetical protein HN842_06935 [Gammaproteobacteria bacterium]|jgi:succinate dehydrogenase hydrophobic anchor subunit|nr:hypothetical protein [Gammaproteobacteria bacterium]